MHDHDGDVDANTKFHDGNVIGLFQFHRYL